MPNLQYKNLDSTVAFRKLRELQKPEKLKKLLTPARVEKFEVAAGASLRYNYAAKQVDEPALDLLQKLADEQQVIEKYQQLYNGKIMNTGEGRMVLHHLVRGQLGESVIRAGKNLREFYQDQQNRVNKFAAKIHSGEIRGSTGQQFDTVVQVGIGGSDLGPRALYLAMQNFQGKDPNDGARRPKLQTHFISNVDPDDSAEVLSRINLESTLFVLVSKSGTTLETLTNEAFVVQSIRRTGIPGLQPKKHIVCVTGESSPLAKPGEYLEAFYIDDFIGGRYSSSSAVGGAMLTLAFGKEYFTQFLDGAHQADRAALQPDIRKNAALLDAMIGVYERNVLGYPYTAVLPYSQALSRFPAHLQQLDMESNGKRVNRNGEPVAYSTGPVVFGEPGTNGQHSFYQLLHQGTDVVPLQFIGFHEPQLGVDVPYEGSNSQQKLNANLAAQIVAFASGSDNADPNKDFPGDRPSSLIYGKQLTPEKLGALLAHFENKIMFQGFVWNINSFDQEGVQLGKVLTKQVLGGGKVDPVLQAFADRLAVDRK
ncbi:MAG TPA: glucose-6-phosphate isomerase [Spirochaetia bacterium]|nr:glucose-6-phosphate isomerase [Spirochaetia bacterium]